jgi:cytochrome c oxidase cbb3-type subunit 2
VRAAVVLTLLFVALLAFSLRPPPPGEPPPRSTPRWAELEVPPRAQPPGEGDELAEKIYGWNCLPCHGPDGKGDGPVIVRLGRSARDFTRGLFKFKTSGQGELPHDDDLYRTILGGVAAGGMPASAQFNSDELWALVDYVKGLSQRTLDDGVVLKFFEARPPKSRMAPPPAGVPDARAGAQLYRSTQCGTCHGAAGRGDGPAAAGLVDELGARVPLPDLTRGEASFKSGERLEDVYRVLTTGMAGTPMPAFDTLKAAERRDLAAYVVSLYRPIPPGEKVFLLAGCLTCHTLGQGRWIGPDLSGTVGRNGRDWLRRWLKDPAGLIATDEKAKALAKEYPVRMPTLGLSDLEIEQLIEFLGSTERR